MLRNPRNLTEKRKNDRQASLFWGFVVAAAIIAGVSMLADWPPAAAISLILLAGLGTWVARGPAGQLPHAPDPAPEPGKLAQGLGRALLEQMPAAILVIADTERLTYLNPAAQRLFPGARSGAHFSGLIRAPDFVELSTPSCSTGRRCRSRSGRPVGYSRRGRPMCRST